MQEIGRASRTCVIAVITGGLALSPVLFNHTDANAK
jgi:hypothetical protein